MTEGTGATGIGSAPDRGDRRRRHRTGGDGRGGQGRSAAGVDIATTEFDLGGARYLRDGEILSDPTLDELRRFDAILLGAVGTPDVPPGVIERGLLLKMRFDLDLYINQRPFVGTAPGHDRPHEFVVIRENTEGPYVGEGGMLRKGTAARGRHPGLGQHPDGRRTLRAVRVRAGGVPRAQARHARAQDQRAHVRRRPVAAHVRRRRLRVPDIATAYNHVDAACIYFVQDPHRYDVIVTDNLFGDILTDLGGAVSGGIGLASSAPTSIRRAPDRRCSNQCTGRRPTSWAPGRPTRRGDPQRRADARLPRRGRRGRRIRTACAEPVSGSTTSVGDKIAGRVRE